LCRAQGSAHPTAARKTAETALAKARSAKIARLARKIALAQTGDSASTTSAKIPLPDAVTRFVETVRIAPIARVIAHVQAGKNVKQASVKNPSHKAAETESATLH